MILIFITFSAPYKLHEGCERGISCENGKSCPYEDNKCPTGCSFAECLQRAKLDNVEGFAFRGASVSPWEGFCKMCGNLP